MTTFSAPGSDAILMCCRFSVFFSNDKFDTAGPQPLGFDGFFRGAYSYHFHNFW